MQKKEYIFILADTVAWKWGHDTHFHISFCLENMEMKNQ